MEDPIKSLQQELREFCRQRQWEAFHNVKDLAIGISTEAGELLEHFRFRGPEELAKLLDDSRKKEEISHELADVFFFVLRFADVAGIDLITALQTKMIINAQKYPAEKARGRNVKSTEL